MILPIVAYGNRLLRTPCEPVDLNSPWLKTFVRDMWETLDNAQGVGLAAPQVGRPVRIFIIDSLTERQHLSRSERARLGPEDSGYKAVFINAQMISRSGKSLSSEGCLSIPGISEAIERPSEIVMSYLDDNLCTHVKTFKGLSARMIQHEYDHIEGKLITDYMSPLRKRLIEGKLKRIAAGYAAPHYPMTL